jgi:hypothetical protein
LLYRATECPNYYRGIEAATTVTLGDGASSAPVIDRVFALKNYETAPKYMADGRFVGKIVLRLEGAGSHVC